MKARRQSPVYFTQEGRQTLSSSLLLALVSSVSYGGDNEREFLEWSGWVDLRVDLRGGGGGKEEGFECL